MALCANPIAILSYRIFLTGFTVHGSFCRFLKQPTLHQNASWSHHSHPKRTMRLCLAVAPCQRFKAIHRWPAVCRFNLFTTKCERPLTLEESDILLSPFSFHSGFSVWFCENIFGKQQTATLRILRYLLDWIQNFDRCGCECPFPLGDARTTRSFDWYGLGLFEIDSRRFASGFTHCLKINRRIGPSDALPKHPYCMRSTGTDECPCGCGTPKALCHSKARTSLFHQINSRCTCQQGPWTW